MPSTTGREFFQQILDSKFNVSLEEAIFRSEQAFKPANLQEHLQFWEEEILKDYPQKTNLLGWIKGVKIEEFLKSFTSTEFQGIKLNSYYSMLSLSQIMSPQNLNLSWITQYRNGHP